MSSVEGIRVDIYFGDKIGGSHWIYSCNIQKDMVSPMLYHEKDAVQFLLGIQESFTRTDANTDDDMKELIDSTIVYLSEMDKSKGFVIEVHNL